MHRCLVQTEQLLSSPCRLDREAARHLQSVLRVQVGDRVQLFDGKGRTRVMGVTEATKQGLALEAVADVAETPRPSPVVTLFVCISKGKRMDWTIEKAVELGVGRIVPVLSEHTVVRVDADERGAKADRWMRVAEEAARQCGTAWIPEVLPPTPFGEVLKTLAESAPVFVAALRPGAGLLRNALEASPRQAGWFVGPEGDFTAAELDALIASGAIPVTLGPLVLRAETACLYGLCVLRELTLKN